MNRGIVSAAGASQRDWGPPAWRAWLPLLLVLALVLLLFHDTVAAMVGIWSRSDTFAHAFLVPPIALWLMWRTRESLRTLPLRSAPVWLLPMAAACVLWLLGWLAGVAAATQFAVVAMLAFSVPLVLGAAVARQLAFPLLFLFFCVPFGDFLVEPMMEATADFTVLALRLSGIPVYREGLQFVIPSGNWSVVEACSGVRYLIASFMVGTLFAALNYRSRKRQLLFVALSLVVPVVANWLRAYMIVMLGHYSGNKLAVGADHLIYGWVFFGVVILIMFSIGARFADVEGTKLAVAGGPAPSVASSGAAEPVAARGHVSWSAVAAAALLLLGTHAVAWRLEQPADGPAPQLTLPAQLPGGWTANDEPLTAWTPQYKNPSAVATRSYRLGDAAVGVWIAHYRNQGFERKLITSTNVLVPQGSAEWLAVPVGARAVQVARGGGGGTQMRATTLRTPADPKANPRQRLLVMQTYRLGGTYVASDPRAKLQLALGRLLGRGDESAVLIFYSEMDEEGRNAANLEHFVSVTLQTFASAVDAASARP